MAAGSRYAPVRSIVTREQREEVARHAAEFAGVVIDALKVRVNAAYLRARRRRGKRRRSGRAVQEKPFNRLHRAAINTGYDSSPPPVVNTSTLPLCLPCSQGPSVSSSRSPNTPPGCIENTRPDGRT